MIFEYIAVGLIVLGTSLVFAAKSLDSGTKPLAKAIAVFLVGAMFVILGIAILVLRGLVWFFARWFA